METKETKLCKLINTRHNLWKSRNWNYRMFDKEEKELDENLRAEILNLKIEMIKYGTKGSKMRINKEMFKEFEIKPLVS